MTQLDDKEREEFDNTSRDRIWEAGDVKKLMRMEKYMRDEGFATTAEVVRQRLQELGAYRAEPNEGDALLASACSELEAWAGSMHAMDSTLAAGLPSGADMPFNAGVRGAAHTAAVVPSSGPVGPGPRTLDPTVRTTLAVREKDKGNECFRAQEYTAALAHYNCACELDPELPGLHANRAAVYLKLENWPMAVEDATRALQLNPHDSKARLRRAKALLESGGLESAMQDVEVCMREMPEGDRDTLSLHKKLLQKLPKHTQSVVIQEVDDTVGCVSHAQSQHGAQMKVSQAAGTVGGARAPIHENSRCSEPSKPWRGPRAVIIEEVDDESDAEGGS